MLTVFSILPWDRGSVLLTLQDGVEGRLGEAGTGNVCRRHALAFSLALSFFPSAELEKQLVALIPYGDQRLKPRRT